LQWPEDPPRTHLVDPCAGEGTALSTLRRIWVQSVFPDSFEAAGPWESKIAIHACELEAERAATLGRDFDFRADHVHHGDAFRLASFAPKEKGATVLYLNPPYDHDAEYGRLEHRFLLRFSQHLHPSSWDSSFPRCTTRTGRTTGSPCRPWHGSPTVLRRMPCRLP